ncbi:Transcriptional factor B3 [mine drainage metagenome]|uniref:Transcriptional factor B3 n=1 Tax=mine drainage metagenome TaxID=410659 RepID=T1BIE4_9ZZZZ
MKPEFTRMISKKLSPNDTGENATHQAGILVPKTGGVLGFFPPLQKHLKNPRCTLVFLDEDGITKWSFEFIYYNGKLFGGTRNEYRLTGMTAYIRSKNLKSGDSIEFSRDSDGHFRIMARKNRVAVGEGDTLSLSPSWKVIHIHQ